MCRLEIVIDKNSKNYKRLVWLYMHQHFWISKAEFGISIKLSKKSHDNRPATLYYCSQLFIPFLVRWHASCLLFCGSLCLHVSRTHLPMSLYGLAMWFYWISEGGGDKCDCMQKYCRSPVALLPFSSSMRMACPNRIPFLQPRSKNKKVFDAKPSRSK